MCPECASVLIMLVEKIEINPDGSGYVESKHVCEDCDYHFVDEFELAPV